MPKHFSWLFSLGLLCGVLGETMLFMQRQCSRVESMLLDDFRVVAFLAGDLPESRVKVLEERLRALPDVDDVRFVSRDESLQELKEQDADLVRSVGLLGENPLNSFFEVRLSPNAISSISLWIDLARRLPELKELRYKPLQVAAIAQLQFYARFLDLAAGLSIFIWFLGAAAGLRAALMNKDSSKVLRNLASGFFISMLGATSGMSLIYLAAHPLKVHSRLWSWPAPETHVGLIVLSALGCCLWREWRSSKKPAGARKGHELSAPPAPAPAPPLVDPATTT